MTHDEYIQGDFERDAPFNQREGGEFLCGDFQIAFGDQIFSGHIDTRKSIPYSQLFDSCDASEEQFEAFEQYVDSLSLDEILKFVITKTAIYI